MARFQRCPCGPSTIYLQYLEMLPLVGPSRLSCRSVRCNRRLVEHGRGPRWWKPRAGHSTWCWVMLSSIKGVFFQECMGLYPGIPQQCPTPNLTIFLSPKAAYDLGGILHHCHLVLSRSEQEKMRQYEFEGHSESWVERCSKSLLGWFQIRRDRHLMICMWAQHSTSLIC